MTALAFTLSSLIGSLLFVETFPVQPPANVPTKTSLESLSRDKLVAWCIVPFDSKKRSPKERAEMLKELGFKEFAYDWRPEHIPSFDQEVDELKKAGIHLRAFWFPAGINSEAKAILNLIERRKLDCELWVTLGEPTGKTRLLAAL